MSEYKNIIAAYFSLHKLHNLPYRLSAYLCLKGAVDLALKPFDEMD